MICCIHSLLDACTNVSFLCSRSIPQRSFQRSHSSDFPYICCHFHKIKYFSLCFSKSCTATTVKSLSQLFAMVLLFVVPSVMFYINEADSFLPDNSLSWETTLQKWTLNFHIARCESSSIRPKKISKVCIMSYIITHIEPTMIVSRSENNKSV